MAKMMNTAAAVEAVKILAPAMPRLFDAPDILQIGDRLTAYFLAKDPPGFIRLLALMFDADPEEIKAQITREGQQQEGRVAVSMFFAGLRVNPILELVMAGADMGMLDRDEVHRWLTKTTT